MPRFVILTHDHPHFHWDFMLEWGDRLRTWRLEKEPALNVPIMAESLPDHRLAYLDYEGPVSGNRGEVKRWDAGEFSIIEELPVQLVVELAGARLRGRVTISRDDENGAEQFQFVYRV